MESVEFPCVLVDVERDLDIQNVIFLYGLVVQGVIVHIFANFVLNDFLFSMLLLVLWGNFAHQMLLFFVSCHCSFFVVRSLFCNSLLLSAPPSFPCCCSCLGGLPKTTRSIAAVLDTSRCPHLGPLGCHCSGCDCNYDCGCSCNTSCRDFPYKLCSSSHAIAAVGGSHCRCSAAAAADAAADPVPLLLQIYLVCSLCQLLHAECADVIDDIHDDGGDGCPRLKPEAELS